MVQNPYGRPGEAAKFQAEKEMKHWLVILSYPNPHLFPQIPLQVVLHIINLNLDESSEPEDTVLMQARSNFTLPQISGGRQP